MSRSRNASVASASSLTSQRSPDTSSPSSLASTPTSTSASFPGLESPRRARRTLASLARAANSGPRRLGPILRKLSGSPRPSSSPTTPSLIWPTLPSVDPSPSRALAEPAARTQSATHASASLGTISDASRQRTRSLRIASTCADIRQVCVLLRPVAETFPGVKIAVSVVEGILTLVEGVHRAHAGLLALAVKIENYFGRIKDASEKLSAHGPVHDDVKRHFDAEIEPFVCFLQELKLKIAPVAHHWQHTFFRIFTISADTQVIEDLQRLFDDVVAEHNFTKVLDLFIRVDQLRTDLDDMKRMVCMHEPPLPVTMTVDLPKTAPRKTLRRLRKGIKRVLHQATLYASVGGDGFYRIKPYDASHNFPFYDLVVLRMVA